MTIDKRLQKLLDALFKASIALASRNTASNRALVDSLSAAVCAFTNATPGMVDANGDGLAVEDGPEFEDHGCDSDSTPEVDRPTVRHGTRLRIGFALHR